MDGDQLTNILAIETAGKSRSVAIVTPAGIAAEMTVAGERSHSRNILPDIETILKAAEIDYPDLTAIATSAGPGSFTGLRIGMACGKGLARALDIPFYPIPTLDGLAAQAAFSPYPVCAVSQARKNELYLALYQPSFPAPPERTSRYLAMAPEEVRELVCSPTLFVGMPGYEEYGLAAILGDCFIPADPRLIGPRGAAIGACALEKFLKGEEAATVDAEPIYVKVSQAEEKLAKKVKGI